MYEGSAQNTSIMPLFEYECRACGRHFEYLTRAAQVPSCPSCQSDDLQKLLSVFAVGADGGGTVPRDAVGPCGSCGDPRGPGSCNLN
jgi:putative FmdB family regulatory protein